VWKWTLRVERGAEALDNGHTAGLESAAYAVRPGAPPKPARHDSDENTQHDAGERGVERHAEPEAERNGQHPLSHRHAGHHVVAEVRGEVCHSTAEARRAEAAALAGKRDEAALPAAVAGDPDESMSQNPALEERLDLVDHEARKAAPAPVLRLGRGHERPPVFREQPIEDRLRRPMARICAVGRRCSRAQGDRVRTGPSHPRLSACSSHRFPVAAGPTLETRPLARARPSVADYAAFSGNQ
jgi:hypothetical protein